MHRFRLLTIIAASWLAAASAAAQGIDLEIVGVEGPLRDNVVAFLSLKRYANSRDLDQDRVDRLALRAVREATDALKPFGYYEATAEASVTALDKGWKAVVTVTPGEPVLLTDAQVEIIGPGRDEEFLREVIDGSPLRVGEQLSHADYDRLKNDLHRVAASRGYLDASWPRAELRVNVPARQATALLTLDTGERYRFGETTIEQDFLEPALVKRYLRYKPGDWYDATQLLRTQFALDDSDYFSVVEVLPEQRDRTAKTMPVHISAERNDRYRYKIGAGYATDTEWRLVLGWTNRQVNRRGHRLFAEGKYSTPEKTIKLNYVIPCPDPAAWNESRLSSPSRNADRSRSLTLASRRQGCPVPKPKNPSASAVPARASRLDCRTTMPVLSAWPEAATATSGRSGSVTTASAENPTRSQPRSSSVPCRLETSGAPASGQATFAQAERSSSERSSPTAMRPRFSILSLRSGVAISRGSRRSSLPSSTRVASRSSPSEVRPGPSR